MDQKSRKTRPRDAKSDKQCLCYISLSNFANFWATANIWNVNMHILCNCAIFRAMHWNSLCSLQCTLSTDGKNVLS